MRQVADAELRTWRAASKVSASFRESSYMSKSNDSLQALPALGAEVHQARVSGEERDVNKEK